MLTAQLFQVNYLFCAASGLYIFICLFVYVMDRERGLMRWCSTRLGAPVVGRERVF